AIAQGDGRRLRVLSRRGTDLAGRLRQLVPLGEVLPAGTTLDGELVVVDADGRVGSEGMRPPRLRPDLRQAPALRRLPPPVQPVRRADRPPCKGRGPAGTARGSRGRFTGVLPAGRGVAPAVRGGRWRAKG